MVATETRVVSAFARDVGGVTLARTIAWSTSASSVVSVSSNGVVTAVGVGVATISASTDGLNGTATITVRLVPVNGIRVTVPSAIMFVGSTTQAAVTVVDSLGRTVTDRVVQWASSSPTIATITNGGEISALAVGSTTISATSEGKSTSSTVTVRAVPVGTVAVTLLPSTVLMGSSASATASVRDSLGALTIGRVLTWTSENTAVATITATGLLTTLSPGSAIVAATSEGVRGTALLTVLPQPVATIAISIGNVGLTPGASSPATTALRDGNGALLTGRAVTFTSGTPAVATVNAAGVVAGVSTGITTITATSEGRSASTLVQVRAPLQPWLLRDSVVVVELGSVFDAHPTHNAALFPNMRSQPALWDMNVLLPELVKLVVPTNYDFLLIFSLQEVPGWINSGSRYALGATNLGVANFLTYTRPPLWNRLRATPHLNWIDFFDSTATTGSTQSPLAIAHELGHQWSAYFTATSCSTITRLPDWTRGTHPTACLAQMNTHWSYLWTRAEGAGILYSGATNPRFNEFDLYAMGLMGYNEVRTVTHQVREDRIPIASAPTYPITIDSLLAAMAAAGPTFCQGNCRRIPDTDASVQSMRGLVVIVKGANETISESRRRTALNVARSFGTTWNTATLGRSSIDLQVVKRP